MAIQRASHDTPQPLTDAHVHETLPKQRRFLILISVTVISYYFLRVGIKNEAEYNGFVLMLEHPSRVI
jgi:hypothetical protein